MAEYSTHPRKLLLKTWERPLSMTTIENPKLPLHTKWGLRVTAVIILLITVMIIKNCMGSFMYGIATEQELQQKYYELGYSHGMLKGQGQAQIPEPETDNLLLRKLYRKGYREGWDSVQSAPKDSTPPDGQ